ncbi:hypothetical protein [Nocardioides sp.]|uniref:hypothetical protein n=1 Tax=Nocardioides sp. TaxID=35761 RepID=UPI0035B4B4E6
MTKQAAPPLRRRRVRRTSVTAGAVLLMSLSVSPGAHADEGDGLLGGVTGVVGGVTEPVVEPVVEVVQSTVPQPVQQPVQEAVAPVVEQVEQAVAPVPGGERATQPVVKAVESVVRPAERPRGADGGGQRDPVARAEPTSTPPADPGDGAVRSSDGPGHHHSDGQDASTPGGTHGNGTPGWTPCEGLSDLPPRGTDVAVPRSGTSAASESSSGVTDDLASRASAADRSDGTDVRSPDARLTDVPWFSSTGGGLGEGGRSSTVPVLAGLLGLVGLLLLGCALVQSRQHA